MDQKYFILICAILILVVVIVIIWVAVSVSNSRQQTLTLVSDFKETYRYVPYLDKDKKCKIDSIKITVTGAGDSKKATISPSSRIEEIIKQHIIEEYQDCLLIREADTFTISETVLKRMPLSKLPTLENLSVLFFNKLSPLLKNIGCRLMAVKLTSEGLRVKHSRGQQT